MRILFLPTLLLLLLSTAACQQEKPSEPLSFSYKQIHLQSDSADSTGPYFEISAKIAYAKGEHAAAINDTIMQLFLMATEKGIPALPEGLDTLARIMKETMEEDFSVTTNYHAYYNINTEVVSTSDSTVCYEAHISCYLGGAHDSHITSLLNFNTRTGKEFDLYDVVQPSMKDSLTTLIVNEIARQLETTSLEGLREMGVFDMIEPEPTENCIITPDTLTFLYNEYDIAPYCMGSFLVKIPRAKL